MPDILRQLQRFESMRAVTVGGAVIPAAFIGILILKYSVDMPQWDEWVVAVFLSKLNQGTLTFSDLFTQQNEYRQFFPNLIFVVLGRVTWMDVRYQMGISFLLASL